VGCPEGGGDWGWVDASVMMGAGNHSPPTPYSLRICNNVVKFPARQRGRRATERSVGIMSTGRD